MKYTQQESNKQILKYKGCLAIRCRECFYNCGNDTYCELKNQRRLYKRCGKIKCRECSYYIDTLHIPQCNYNYLKEYIKVEKEKLKILKKILK